MWGNWGIRVRDDAGMTLIEIVVAAVILFIALTGVLGLVGQTAVMSTDAVESTMLTNVVNSYVEYVQSLPFDDVALEADGGVLPSSTTTDTDGVSVTIAPTVTPGEEPLQHTKTLALLVTSVRPDGQTRTMNTAVVIRDKSQYLTQAVRDPRTDPQVAFTAPTPADDTVVWDCYWMDGATQRPLALGLSADATEGRTITNVVVWIDDSWVARDTAGTAAAWLPNVRNWSSASFVWNTRQTEPVLQADGVTYVDTPIIPDGSRTLSAYATDSEGIVVYTVRRVIVDNYAPGLPGRPVPTLPNTAYKTDLTWTPATDGTLPADHYRVHAHRLKSAEEYAADPASEWVNVYLADRYPTEPAYGLTTVPFSRYIFAVHSASPRGLESGHLYTASAFTSRPLLTGVYTLGATKVSGKIYYNLEVNLAVTPPAMRTTGTTSYTWHGKAASGAEYAVVTNTPYASYTVPTVVGSAPQVQWWVEVTYTPAGVTYGNGVQRTIPSNRVGPNGTTVGTATFPEGTW